MKMKVSPKLLARLPKRLAELDKMEAEAKRNKKLRNAKSVSKARRAGIPK